MDGILLNLDKLLEKIWECVVDWNLTAAYFCLIWLPGTCSWCVSTPKNAGIRRISKSHACWRWVVMAALLSPCAGICIATLYASSSTLSYGAVRPSIRPKHAAWITSSRTKMLFKCWKSLGRARGSGSHSRQHLEGFKRREVQCNVCRSRGVDYNFDASFLYSVNLSLCFVKSSFINTIAGSCKRIAFIARFSSTCIATPFNYAWFSDHAPLCFSAIL